MAVYLIRAGEHGPVKIGFTDDVIGRLVKMQADNHELLVLLRLFHGGTAEELTLHNRFADLHIRGEWFAFSAAMLGDLGIAEMPIPSRVAKADRPDIAYGCDLFTPAEIEASIARSGVTIQQVCKQIGIAYSTFWRWRAGATEPGIDVYGAFVKAAGLGDAKLLGPEDIERAAADAKASVAAICRSAGIAPTTFVRWKSGKTSPTLGVYRRIVAASEKAAA